MTTQEPGDESEKLESKQRMSRAKGTKSAERREVTGEPLDTSSTTDRLATVRGLLLELGLRDFGVAKLDTDNVVKLAGLLSSEGQRSQLIRSMFNSVADTTPDKLKKLVSIMESYSGSFTILETFLAQLGESNPFLAAAKAQILILQSNDSGTARGASGHILKGVTYCAYDKEMPTNSTGYLSGRQAITKIFEAFSPERVTDEARARVRNRRTAELRSALRDLDLESISLHELENHPELREELRSQLLTRNLAVYDELRRAIEDYKGRLSDIIYSGEVILPGINSLKVSQDPGRQFFGWFQEHFRENPNAPEGIKIAYESLRDENAALSEAEEAYFIRGLLAYQRMHSYINKNTALGGLVSDLQVYENLELNDPLRLDPQIESARRMLQHTIASTPSELSISEFSTILENAAMVQFRREMNKRVLDLYRADFEKALTLFEFVSFERGNWREDALSDSVPMDRLRQHFYGARVGVAHSFDPVEKKRALLGRPDFRNIMDAQFLRRLVTAEDKLLNAKPVTEFKAMVEGVVVAYRKVLILEEKLTEFAATPEGAAAVASLNRENVGETLAAWKPVLIFGNDFRPAEAWYAETREPKPQLRSIAEIAVRIKDRKFDLVYDRSSNTALREKYASSIRSIEMLAEKGLYVEEMDELWRSIEAAVVKLVPAADHQELINRATRLVANPMVFRIDYFKPELLSHKFLSEHELANIERILQSEAQLHQACEGYNEAQLGELRARLQRRGEVYLFIGKAGTYPSGRGRLSLEFKTLAEFVGVDTANSRSRSCHYYEPAQLQEALDLLDASCISAKELGDDWVNRAMRLCSRYGKPALDAHGFLAVDNDTYRAAQQLRASERYVVSREFAEAVNRLLPTGSR